MGDYNTIQYQVPDNTEMMILIPSEERSIYMTLLHGTAVVKIDFIPVDLPLGQEIPISTISCLTPILKSTSKCVFKIRGSHYVSHTMTKMGDTLENLIVVSLKSDSSVFVLKKWIQLQVLVEENSRVKLEAIRGAPGISGFSLVRKKSYRLEQCSSVLVNSLDNQTYTIDIKGKNRKIIVSLLDENTWTCMNSVYARTHTLRVKAMNNRCTGPTILVIGPPNVGKTSFCHFILNKAVLDGMYPVYIDLDIRGNSNTIPGAVSLTEIKSQRHPTECFPRHAQNILQFGSINIDTNNIKFYYQLIRRMSELLTMYQTENITQYSGAVIDLYGYLGQDNSTIDCVLESFKIDLVVVIGDQSYYDAMKNSLLKTKESEFIPQPQNIEPRDDTRETKFRDVILRKYFYSRINKPREPLEFEVKFSDIKIYRVVFAASNGSVTSAKSKDLSLEPVACAPLIEYHVLGVSQAEDINEYSPVSEVKYFVYFTKVDMKKEIVTVLSPQPVPFTREILIMGEVKMTEH